MKSGPAPHGVSLWPALVPLLTGMAASFLACCLLGWCAASRDVYHDLRRFHAFVNIESGHYPTASHLLQYVRGRLRPDKIAVLVGGNSILYGVRQPVGHVWTDELQAQLGDEFVVINVATPGAQPHEFGGLLANCLLAEQARFVFLSDLGSSTRCGPLDGGHYRYLFWDAYYKGLLPADAYPHATVEALRQQRGEDGAFAELTRGMWLDHYTRARDLWSAVAYERCSTIWNFIVRRSFTQARRLYADPHWRRPPPPVRVTDQQHKDRMQAVRDCATATPDVLVGDLPGCFPAALRERTLLLAIRDSPYYVDQLGPEVRASYEKLFASLPAKLEGLGFGAAVIGEGYSADDYFDLFHLTEEGGAKMAAKVAPRVRELARRLGYLAQE